MTGFWNPVSLFLRAFLLGWGNALLSGLPARLQPYFRISPPVCQRRVGCRDDLEELFSEFPEGHEAQITIAGELSLHYEFSIPITARHEVKNIVRLEAERVLPLDAELLTTSFQIERRAGSDVLAVHLVAIEKQLSDQIFTAATKHHVVLSKLSVEHEHEGEVSKIPLSFAVFARQVAVRWGVVALLIITGMGILSQAPAIYGRRLEKAIVETDSKIRELRLQTETIASLQRRVRVMQSLAGAVENERRKSRYVDLIKQLTEASPDDVVLHELRIDENRLSIRGVANAPEEWVLALQNNDAFEEVTLNSIVGAGDGRGRRFDLRMGFVWPAERGLVNE